MAVITIHLVTSSFARSDDKISTIKKVASTRVMKIPYDYFNSYLHFGL